MTPYTPHDDSIDFEHLGNTSVLNEAQACIRNICIRFGVPEHEVSGVVMAVFEELGLCEVQHTVMHPYPLVPSGRSVSSAHFQKVAEDLREQHRSYAERFAIRGIVEGLVDRSLATIEQLPECGEDEIREMRRLRARMLVVTKHPSKNPAIPQRKPEKG